MIAGEVRALLEEAGPGVELESPCLIAPVAGYTPVMGHLVSMLTYVRVTTLRAVAGLSVAQLDTLLDPEANSIGMLLEHLACVEEWYQEDTFGWTLDPAARERRQLGADLGQSARERIRGHDLASYRHRLSDVRGRTLAELARHDDAWLLEERPWQLGLRANTYFRWFHVLEDELNHRGQIRVLRKRLPAEAT